MDPEVVQKALEFSEDRYVFVATSSADGLPHLAAAGQLHYIERDRVAVEEWFCPGTIENLEENPRVALVVWDPETDEGYQLLGRVEGVEAEAVMDGYAPEAEPEEPLPQEERRIQVRVECVLDFRQAPHSDRPEGESCP